MASYKVWNCGNFTTINTGDAVTVFRCGGGLSTFGEPAIMARATSTHLVFVTESGAEVKTKIDNISHTVGKARADRYCVSLRPFDSFEHMIKSAVSYWNPKTCEFDKK